MILEKVDSRSLQLVMASQFALVPAGIHFFNEATDPMADSVIKCRESIDPLTKDSDYKPEV